MNPYRNTPETTPQQPAPTPITSLTDELEELEREVKSINDLMDVLREATNLILRDGDKPLPVRNDVFCMSPLARRLAGCVDGLVAARLKGHDILERLDLQTEPTPVTKQAC